MNYTNEGGVEGTTRFLKNIMGMWLIQECRRAWLEEKIYSWDEMVLLAKNAEPFQFLINPDDDVFLNPANMPDAIAAFCERSGQGKPESHAQLIRCVYDSLALKYRYTLEQIRTVSEQSIDKIHIIGGGANNRFLNQLTADATKLRVIAGPTEATATGNILVQAKAMGALHSLADMREVVRNSFDVEEFLPNPALDWDEAYEKYQRVVQSDVA
jgi:rhamnulokinase